ncbi:membrane protein [Planotetraspora thailandica]|uniref:Membrane protein n=1 Tax=Planotetraspora thailandica TaxID=487172 RepID=A0A8J3VBA1_9ACTN|nr:membrane protein [Planotetraspora thailandica]
MLLAVHVLAAIMAIGPVAVAASMFPAAVRRAGQEGTGGVATVRTLHRICRVYSAVGLAVPAFGLATANSLHVLGDTWVIVSIALTALAAAVLALFILPRQDAALAALGSEPAAVDREATVRLAMATGVFNLLWAVVTVLMIVRPGSTTGV